MPNFSPAQTFSLYSDPVLFNWAVGEVDDTEFASENKRQWVLDTFFNDLAIHHHLTSQNAPMIGRMLSRVPAERFRNHLDALIDNWPGWTETTAWRGAEVIAKLNPPAAANLFMSYLNQAARQKHGDIFKLLGIVEALRHVETEPASRLFELLAEQVGSIEDSHFVGWILSGMSMSGLRLDRPETGDIIRRWLTSGIRDEDTLTKALNRIMGGMVKQETEVQFVRDFMMGYTEQALLPLGETLFVPDAPLDEIDAVLLELKEGDAKAAQTLTDRFLSGSPPSWISEKFCTPTALRVFQEMVNGDVEFEFVDEIQRPWRHAFAVAGLLACWRLPEINLAGLSLDRCLDVVTADLELPSGLETSLPVLQAANRDIVVDRLTQAAKKSPNTYTAVYTLTMMGHLGYSEFLPVLVEALNWDFQESRHAAASAMDRFGETAIEYIDEHFDDYKGFERVMMTGVAARMATPSAVGFMDRHFDDLYEAEAELFPFAIAGINAANLTDKLAAKTGKGHRHADHAYVVQTKLSGIDDPEVAKLSGEVEFRLLEQERRMDALSRGSLGDLSPLLPLNLKCRNCDHTATYDVTEVWLTQKTDTPSLFLAEEVACLNCGAISDFEFTTDAFGAITGEALRLGIGRNDADDETDIPSALMVVSFDLGDGIERSATEIMDHFSEAADDNPDDPIPRLRLANFFMRANRPTDAQTHYQETLTVDERFPEVYFSLAQISLNTDDQEAALSLLDRGKDFGDILPCRKPIGTTNLTEFVSRYVSLYNSLVKARNINHPLLHPSAFKTKLGRNDPCPLGKGKKGKKGCGGG